MVIQHCKKRLVAHRLQTVGYSVLLTVLDDAVFEQPPTELLRLLPSRHLTLLHQPVDEL